MNCLKRLFYILIGIIVITLLLAVPVGINYLVLTPTPEPFKVADPSNEWLNFFAVYFGSVIAAIVSFTVLYLTIIANKEESKKYREDNHNENVANRKQLNAAFKYQVDREVLNTVRTYLANYVQSLNFIELGYISNYPKERVNDSLLKIKMISSNVIQFYELLELTLEEYNDDKAKEFKESLIRFHNEYLGLIADFGWILDFYVYKKIEADRKIEVQKYKEFIKSTGNYYNEEKRIWKLLEDGDYNIYIDAPILMNKLLDRLDFSSVIKDIRVFIKYEQTKIEETITKQLFKDFK